jgi:hypothetical protein
MAMNRRDLPDFSSPGVLTPDTILFGGITAREWNEFFLGGMQKTLDELKARVESPDYKKRDMSEASGTYVDLAKQAESLAAAAASFDLFISKERP